MSKIVCGSNISDFLDKKKEELEEWDDFGDPADLIRLSIEALANSDFIKLFNDAEALWSSLVESLCLQDVQNLFNLKENALTLINGYDPKIIENEDEDIHEDKIQGEEELPEFPTSISSWLGHSSILYGYLQTTTKDQFVKRIIADFNSPLITVSKRDVSTNLAKYKADLYKLLYNEKILLFRWLS